MAYTFDEWQNRIQNRVDLTGSPTHLTKQRGTISALQVLLEILRDGKIKGSTTLSGYIVGRTPAVCFFDAPPYALCETIDYERKRASLTSNDFARYEPYGLMFDKRLVYFSGGRPVIYDKTEAAKSYLPESEWWRIVRLDLTDKQNIVDFTHEREWRIPDEFEFDVTKTTVVVPNGEKYREFEKLSKRNGDNVAAKVRCILPLNSFYL